MPPQPTDRENPPAFFKIDSSELQYMNEVLNRLWHGTEQARETPGTLTRWRRGLGRTHVECPFLSMEVAEILRSRKNPGDEMQEAVFQALALYAAHQQSVHVTMHDGSRKDYPRGKSLGRALGSLCAQRAPGQTAPWRHDDNKGVVRLLEAAVTSHSVPELVGHVRHAVSLLRQEAIPLDYTRLTRDIYDWSGRSRGKAATRWATDFYAPVFVNDDSNIPGATDEEN